MRDRIIRLYRNGRLTDEALKKAVRSGLITAADYKELTGEDYIE